MTKAPKKQGRPAKGTPWQEAAELLVTLPTISQIFRVTDRTINRRLISLKPEREDGVALYRLGDVAPLIVMKEEAEKEPAQDGELDPAQERARTEKAWKIIALDEMTLLNESIMQIVIGTLERSALTKEEIEACRADMVKEMEGKMDE